MYRWTHFLSKEMRIFFYPAVSTYVLGAQKTSHRDVSFEYPQLMFRWEMRKLIRSRASLSLICDYHTVALLPSKEVLCFWLCVNCKSNMSLLWNERVHNTWSWKDYVWQEKYQLFIIVNRFSYIIGLWIIIITLALSQDQQIFKPSINKNL